jgi:ribosomal protein S18 acetylase RimI-like enzyme
MTRYHLRPATPADAELLYRVYASTRTEELAQVPFTEEQKEAFLRMQFAAQDGEYRRSCPSARFLVVMVGDEPAGRLYLDRRAGELRIVDVALLPAYRGVGLGTALLRGVLAEGEQQGLPVTIHVEVMNRARRLYQRLGFRPVAEHGAHLLMEWKAPAGVS